MGTAKNETHLLPSDGSNEAKRRTVGRAYLTLVTDTAVAETAKSFLDQIGDPDAYPFSTRPVVHDGFVVPSSNTFAQKATEDSAAPFRHMPWNLPIGSAFLDAIQERAVQNTALAED